MKPSLKLIAGFIACALLSGTAWAQTLTNDTFIGALDAGNAGGNTFIQGSDFNNPGFFSNPVGFTSGTLEFPTSNWLNVTGVNQRPANILDSEEDQSSNSSDFSISSLTSATGSGGYLASVADLDIVTVVTGLTPGQLYDVDVVYTGVFGNTLPLAAGLSSTGVNELLTPFSSAGNTLDTRRLDDETTNNGSGFVYEQDLGQIVADANGSLSVFLNPIEAGDNNADYGYNGVAISAINSVPEPSSVALIGLLGSFALSRRRRR